MLPWIWWKGEASPRNAHLLFRKRLSLASVPGEARVRISADSRYRLFVNAKAVCRGPARYFPEHVCVDEADLAPFLQEGENEVLVHVHHFGQDTYDSIHVGQGGLAVEGDLLRTDASWEVSRHPGWESGTARMNTRLGFQEMYDARRAGGFLWEKAVVLPPGRVPWKGEEARDVPFLVEAFEPFAKVHSARIVRSLVHEGSPRDLAWEVRAVRDLREGPSDLETLGPLPEGEALALLLELPCQRTGHPLLEVESREGGEEILLSYAELLHWGRFHQEAHGEALYGDLYVAAPGRQEWQTFFQRSFRYVWVIVRNLRSPLKVRRIGFVSTSYPITREASFACSDPRLNRIWQVSLDTQATCMAADAYVDSFRERAQWWGTGVMAPIRFNAYMGADLSLARRGLRQAAQSQRGDGQITANFPNRVPVPAEGGESVGLVVPDISLQWILTLHDYARYSGDLSVLQEHAGAVARLLAWYEGRLGPDGLLKPIADHWVFLDWKTSRRLNSKAQSASLNLFYAMALELSGSPLADRVKRAVMEAFYDPADGFLHEYRLDGRRLERVSLHANVLGVLAGLPGLDTEALAKRLFSGLVGWSYWEGPEDADIGFYLFVLEAMARTGYTEKALELVRHRWGALLDCGLTTWPEFWPYDIHVRAGGAMSVAWGNSPCLLLAESVLGVQPTSPGFRTFRWAPSPCGLDWIRAVVPAPAGPLRLSLEKGLARSEVPEGMEGEFRFGHLVRPLPPGRHEIRI